MLVIAAGLIATATLAWTPHYPDIEPILRRRCQSCHRRGGIAPMAFDSYRAVRPWARAIRDAVTTRRMPPWFAHPSALRFANDPSLPQSEIATVEEWVRSGAPRGKPVPAHTPPVERFQADLEVAMPTPIRIPASGVMDYQYVVIPLNLDRDRWAEAVEIRPGFRQAVHHAVAYIREPGTDWLRDAPIGRPFARPGVTTADILATYAPGQSALRFPPGTAKRVRAGSDLVLQLHYTPNGKAGADRTSVAIAWAKSEPAHQVLTLQIATTAIRIPPGERNHRVMATGTLPNDALLLSFFPHMHLRGKAFEYSIAEPGGRVRPLLRVEPYNFHWQLDYRLAEPLPLTKGTRLRCEAWYDNSANNPRNPDPSAEVTYGEQSTDEMLVGFFDVAVPASMSKRDYFVREN